MSIIAKLDSSEIRIGGYRDSLWKDYWSHPDVIGKSLEETNDLLQSTLRIVRNLREEAIALILEVFRTNPTRKYEYIFRSIYDDDPNVWLDQMHLDGGPNSRIEFLLNGSFRKEQMSGLFVDSDGIIKAKLLESDFLVELGDIDSAEEILKFMCSAKDISTSSRDAISYGGVFYSD